jgi:hypothetical protein
MQDGEPLIVCKHCGHACIPSKGVIPPNIIVVGKEKRLTVAGSFLGLIFSPVKTVDRIIAELLSPVLLIPLLLVYVLSILVAAIRDLEVSIPQIWYILRFQIGLLLFFALVIEAICRIASRMVDRIKGWDYYTGLLAGALYIFTLLNVSAVLFSFIPSSVVQQLLSYAQEVWFYCLCSLFVSEIYEIDFVPALGLSFVGLAIAMAINVYFFILGPFGMRLF